MTDYNYNENKYDMSHTIKYTKDNDQAYIKKSPILLLEAISRGNKDTVIYLINSGVDPKFVDMNGNTFFYHIYRKFKDNDTIIELFNALLKKSNNMDEYYEISDKGNLIKYSSEDPINVGNKIDKSSLYVANCRGNTILTAAMEYRNNQITDYLLSQTDLVAIMQGNYLPFFKEYVKVNPNRPDKNGMLPLHTAIKFGSERMVKIALDGKADLYKADLSKNYPLHIAIEKNDPEIVRLLLNANASPNKVNPKGETPLLVAVTQNTKNRGRNFEIVKLLLDSGAKVNEIINKNEETVMFYTEDEDNIKLLVQKAAYVEECGNKNGITPLVNALNKKKYQVAKCLLECGADSNYDFERYCSKNIYNTPIFHAIKGNDAKALQLLIDYKVNVNRRRWKNSKTPLLFAIEYSTPGIVEILLKNGASVCDIDYSNTFDCFEHVYLSDDPSPNEKLKLLLKYGVNHYPNTIRHLKENYFEKCPEFTAKYERKWFNKWGDWVLKN